MSPSAATTRPIATSTPSTPGLPATVVRVVDGDTIDVRLSDSSQPMRLILIDTPEVFGGVDCYGHEASAFTASLLLPSTTVTLERDVSETDRFGRLLRYVWLADGTMLNERIVREGYATLSTFPGREVCRPHSRRGDRRSERRSWSVGSMRGDADADSDSDRGSASRATGASVELRPFVSRRVHSSRGRRLRLLRWVRERAELHPRTVSRAAARSAPARLRQRRHRVRVADVEGE